jgi:hypothetical protein
VKQVEHYHSVNGIPNFPYKVVVPIISDVMVLWCKDHEDGDYRYCINWGSSVKKVVELQFENEQTAIIFALKFA